jgi:membrane-anchored protein YejM (alkaline phosphatase superfamily)
MLNKREALCVFLASVLLFSSFSSFSFSSPLTGRNNNLPKTYAQSSALGVLQQQQQQRRLQTQQRQQQQPSSSLSPFASLQQQQQLPNRGIQSLSPNNSSSTIPNAQSSTNVSSST